MFCNVLGKERPATASDLHFSVSSSSIIGRSDSTPYTLHPCIPFLTRGSGCACVGGQGVVWCGVVGCGGGLNQIVWQQNDLLYTPVFYSVNKHFVHATAHPVNCNISPIAQVVMRFVKTQLLRQLCMRLFCIDSPTA